MSKEQDVYNKLLHFAIAGCVSIMAWLLVTLYEAVTSDIDEIDDRVEEYQIEAVSQSRGSSEKLGQYMLEIERRLSRLEKEETP